MPEPDALRTDDLREALLDQLAYLLDEVDALRPLTARVPEPLLEGRPLPDDLSIKEYYGRIAAADEAFFTPLARRMTAGDAPRAELPDAEALRTHADWQALSLDDLLTRIHTARTALLDVLAARDADAWRTAGAELAGTDIDLFRLAHLAVQHDADTLRAIGLRLHESYRADPHGPPG